MLNYIIIIIISIMPIKIQEQNSLTLFLKGLTIQNMSLNQL